MSRINYDLTKIKGIVFDVDGVLSPATVPMGDDGRPCRMANLKDGYAMQHAVKKGMKFAIITGADTESIVHRFNIIGIKDIYLKASHKMEYLTRWMEKENLKPEEVAYVGDDIPDIEPMKAVGLSVTPADGAHELKSFATYISPFTGGHGVARDLVEQVLAAQGLWASDAEAFGW